MRIKRSFIAPQPRESNPLFVTQNEFGRRKIHARLKIAPKKRPGRARPGLFAQN